MLLRKSKIMPAGFIEPCLPSHTSKPPTAGKWPHEIKVDGFRLLAIRNTSGVRLLTRHGTNWTDRFPNVARGGSWADQPARLRSAARRGSDKSWIRQDPQRPQSIWWLTDAEFVGFRIVRAVADQDNLKGLRSTTTRDSN